MLNLDFLDDTQNTAVEEFKPVEQVEKPSFMLAPVSNVSDLKITKYFGIFNKKFMKTKIWGNMKI